MADKERALSDLVAQMLIAFLVILIIGILVASLTGVLTTFLKAPGLLVVSAAPHDTNGGHVIRLHHDQGNPVNLNGTTQYGGKTEITILLVEPSGSLHVVRNAVSMGPDPWSPGKELYIYPAAGGYVYRDTPPAGSPVTPGDYTIRIIDQRTVVLLHAIPVTVP